MTAAPSHLDPPDKDMSGPEYVGMWMFMVWASIVTLGLALLLVELAWLRHKRRRVDDR